MLISGGPGGGLRTGAVPAYTNRPGLFVYVGCHDGRWLRCHVTYPPFARGDPRAGVCPNGLRGPNSIDVSPCLTSAVGV